jgi:hypothetical protein
MKKFLTIVEGKGPLNRSTSAEALTMQHYAEPKKTITAPVLNVAEGTKPSMIGKYFATVEQELREAAERPNDRATKLAKRIIERIVPNADGSLPDPSINRLTGKPNSPAAEPAPSNLKPGGSTVEYGGSTYSVNVFGDGIRPRIGRSDKVVGAKAYVVGDKMYVLLDTPAQEGIEEGISLSGFLNTIGKTPQSLAKVQDQINQRIMAAGKGNPAVAHLNDAHNWLSQMYKNPTEEQAKAFYQAIQKANGAGIKESGVAGPKDCWPGHRKVGTQPGTGKNAGKRVNDCEKIGKKAGKK